MSKTRKRLPIVTAVAGITLASIAGAYAQSSHGAHHARDEQPAASPASPTETPLPPRMPAAAAPMRGGGMEGMMSSDPMTMMTMMQEMHGKMMGGGMAMQSKGDTGPSSQAFNGLITRMTQHMTMPFTGDADIDFAKRMIPHHQGAIDLARTVLAFGKDPETKTLAESIIKTQKRKSVR